MFGARECSPHAFGTNIITAKLRTRRRERRRRKREDHLVAAALICSMYYQGKREDPYKV
jgi:hypothetical protein